MELKDIDLTTLDPRVHGNGFIQCDLDPERRLHVWGHPDIPRQRVHSPVHDHIFDFTSHVLKGRLINVVYDVVVGFNNQSLAYHMYEAQPPLPGAGHDSKLMRLVNETYDVQRHHVDVVNAGDNYFMQRLWFHESIPAEPTITVIRKSGKTLKDDPESDVQPRVLVRRDQEPDNDFNRHAYDRDFLIHIIDQVMKS